jgi:hypothetical protein
MKKMYSDDSEKLRGIKDAALRRKFIKGTLIVYNERSAPFAIFKTVGYIRKQLAKI